MLEQIHTEPKTGAARVTIQYAPAPVVDKLPSFGSFTARPVRMDYELQSTHSEVSSVATVLQDSAGTCVDLLTLVGMPPSQANKLVGGTCLPLVSRKQSTRNLRLQLADDDNNSTGQNSVIQRKRELGIHREEDEEEDEIRVFSDYDASLQYFNQKSVLTEIVREGEEVEDTFDEPYFAEWPNAATASRDQEGQFEAIVPLSRQTGGCSAGGWTPEEQPSSPTNLQGESRDDETVLFSIDHLSLLFEENIVKTRLGLPTERTASSTETFEAIRERQKQEKKAKPTSPRVVRQVLRDMKAFAI